MVVTRRYRICHIPAFKILYKTDRSSLPKPMTHFVFFVITGLVVSYLLYLNIIATVLLVRSELFRSNQKVWQSVIVWTFPFVGAYMVLYFLHEPMSTRQGGHLPLGAVAHLLLPSPFTATQHDNQGHISISEHGHTGCDGCASGNGGDG